MATNKKSLNTIKTFYISKFKASTLAPQVGLQSTGKTTKCYEEIPKKKSFLPSQMGLIWSGGPGYLHKHCDKRHKELGPIFRERLGPNELVFIANTDMFRTVIANEGPQPHHNVPEAWLLYNQMKGIERGIFFQTGDSWLRLRRAFNKVLLTDNTKITRYSSDILKLNRDLIQSWLSDDKKWLNGGLKITDVKSTLCNWSIEATGLMLFGQRMGCVASSDTSQIDVRSNELVVSVANMFNQTSKFQIIPPKLAMNFHLNCWKSFEVSSDRMLKIATEFTNEIMHKVKTTDANVSILKDLINLNCLNNDEICRSMVDLIIAAADTTSNTLQWLLYSLAKHKNVQTKIYEEMLSFKERSDEKPDGYMISKSSYRNAVIKEVMRLYPTAPFLARTLDHQITLDSYEIPSGTPIIFSLYTTSRSEQYFEDSHEFKPERWLRHRVLTCPKISNINHAYASLPFGVGSRMCIGKRMADLEMDLLLAFLVTNFEILLLNPKENVSIKLKMILGPNKPINLYLKPR